MNLYKALFRPFLFLMDGEQAHNLAISLCEFAGRYRTLKSLIGRPGSSDKKLVLQVAGLNLCSPVALGAGFDKNARAINILSRLGFGAIEIGAVSAQPCAGNAGCRAIRLIDDRSVVTRYGVPNDGTNAIAPRFAHRERSIPVGVNIIWNNSGNPAASIHEIVQEISLATSQLLDCVDYATINFACPNMKGGSHFDDIENIRILLNKLDELDPKIPIFLKLKHHESDEAWLDDFLSLTCKYSWISGFIPIIHSMREMGHATEHGGKKLRGSVSGALIKEESLNMIRVWYRKMDRDRHALVATGGLSSAQDVYNAIAAGASFVQIFAGMIFEGPFLARRINHELVELMNTFGVESVAALRGSACDRFNIEESSQLLKSVQI